jgi:8-oxo-dGTP diphosphatase
MSEAAPDNYPEPPAYRLSSAVFVQRDGKILILKRAVGAAVGGWYLPGGALDLGETIDECARREMLEECGLAPAAGMTCVAVAHMRVYGYDSLQVLYACDCPDGEVTLSEEHSGYRWIDPREYRDRYFSDDVISGFADSHARLGEMVRNIGEAVDAYLRWRELSQPT